MWGLVKSVQCNSSDTVHLHLEDANRTQHQLKSKVSDWPWHPSLLKNRTCTLSLFMRGSTLSKVDHCSLDPTTLLRATKWMGQGLSPEDAWTLASSQDVDPLRWRDLREKLPPQYWQKLCEHEAPRFPPAVEAACIQCIDQHVIHNTQECPFRTKWTPEQRLYSTEWRRASRMLRETPFQFWDDAGTHGGLTFSTCVNLMTHFHPQQEVSAYKSVKWLHSTLAERKSTYLSDPLPEHVAALSDPPPDLAPNCVVCAEGRWYTRHTHTLEQECRSLLQHVRSQLHVHQPPFRPQPPAMWLGATITTTKYYHCQNTLHNALCLRSTPSNICDARPTAIPGRCERTAALAA